MNTGQSSSHSYLSKLPDWEVGQKDLQLLRFMEDLNRAEWRDFFRDLATEPSYVSPHFALRIGEDIVVYLASYLKQTGLSTRQNAAGALDALITERLAPPVEDDLTQIIKTYFFLAKMLEEGIQPNILQAVLKDEKFSIEIRRDAAAVLANLRAPLPANFWLELDYLRAPFLAPAAIAAIGETQPLLAFDVLSKLSAIEDQRPDEIKKLIPALKYPMKAILKALRQRESDKLLFVREKVEELSPILREFVSNLRSSTDLFASANAERVGVGTVIPFKARRAWEKLVIEVISAGKLPYYYTGYQRGNVFRGDQVIDEEDIETQFLSAIRDEIRESAGHPDIEITFNRLDIHSLGKLVQNVTEGKALMPEVAYGTKVRGEKADLISVGRIEHLAALVPHHLQEKFEVSLEIAVDRTEKRFEQKSSPLLDRVIDFCINQRIQWINQPNSAVADITDDLFERDKRRHARTNEPLACPGGVEDPAWIGEKLTQKRPKPRYIGLVDYLTAEGIKRRAPKKKLELYKVRYSRPLPVGYFIPKRDNEFLVHLWRAVHKVLFDAKGEIWKPKFVNLMAKSDVFLDARPSIQVYNVESSEWEVNDAMVTRVANVA
jgi:hypothetical protein